MYIFFLLAHQLPVGHGLLLHEVSRSHTTKHNSRNDSSEWVISSSQRPLPDNTQHSQRTDIHARGWIFLETFIVLSITYIGTYITSVSCFGSAFPIPCHLAVTLTQPNSSGCGGGGFPSPHRVPSWQRFAPSFGSRLESGHCLEYR